MIDHERTPQSPPQILPLPAGSKRSLWSVMIPAFNCSSFLSKTLSSVLEQDPGPELMQIVVVDDCSTDADVESLVKEIGKGRIDFYRQPYNRGSLRNFETCINLSIGERIHILHGDDFVMPGFYTEMDKLFDMYPDAGAAFTGFKYVSPENMDLWPGKKLADVEGIVEDIFDVLAEGQVIQPPSIALKRSLYEDLGSFYGVHYGEDWNMWVRVAAKYKMVYSPKELARYRLHPNNITTRSLLSGDNITDTLRVIDAIQPLIPEEKRLKVKKKAIKSYSRYFAKVSDSLHNLSPDSALLQVKSALKMHVNVFTIYHFFKIMFKRVIRYKMA